MRSILLICAVWLMITAVGCRRSGQQSTNNGAGTTPVSNGLAEDRTRARSLLDKGEGVVSQRSGRRSMLAFMKRSIGSGPRGAHFGWHWASRLMGKVKNRKRSTKSQLRL